jgi:hypothetical protein
MRVEVEFISNASVGTIVHVGGNERRVAVAEGITTNGGNVGGGKGFNIESGFRKSIPTPKLTPKTASNKPTVRMSQMDIFMALHPFLTNN